MRRLPISILRKFGAPAALLALVAVTPAVPAAEPSRAAGSVFRDCDDCLEMVVVPPGGFLMTGAPARAGSRSHSHSTIIPTFARRSNHSRTMGWDHTPNSSDTTCPTSFASRSINSLAPMATCSHGSTSRVSRS